MQGEAIKHLEDLEGPGGVLTSLARSRQVINRIRALPADQRASASADLAEARALLEKVRRQRPDDPRVLLGFAQLDDLEGHADQAIVGYSRVLQLGNNDLDVLRRTIELQSETGRYDQAAILLTLLRNGARAVTAQIERNGSAAENSDYRRALDLAEQTIKKGSTDYRDYVWLGHLRFAIDRQADAETPLRKAVELAPDNAIAQLALIEYLAETNIEKARAAVETAADVLAASQEGLPLAYAYDVVELPVKADQIYRKALGLPQDGPAARTCSQHSCCREHFRLAQLCGIPRASKPPERSRTAPGDVGRPQAGFRRRAMGENSAQFSFAGRLRPSPI